MRNELGHRQMEIGDLQQKLKQSHEARDDYSARYDALKLEMIKLKRQIDKDKELQLTKQAEELEQLKSMMRAKQM